MFAVILKLIIFRVVYAHNNICIYTKPYSIHISISSNTYIIHMSETNIFVKVPCYSSNQRMCCDPAQLLLSYKCNQLDLSFYISVTRPNSNIPKIAHGPLRGNLINCSKICACSIYFGK